MQKGKLLTNMGKLERIDKIIASQGRYSRSEVRKLVAKQKIYLDGEPVRDPGTKADPESSLISVDGEAVSVKKNVYLMLNKPAGYVSATEDKNQPVVLELVPAEFSGRELFPMGRLDKDTTGLMVISDDGVMAHNILSPKKHVKKVYDVELDVPATDEMVRRFAEGIELNDGVCKAAGMEITGEKAARVTLSEGRYHQIKRMFGCCGAKVVRLHRVAMGNLWLPEELLPGECRELTERELRLLQERG